MSTKAPALPLSAICLKFAIGLASTREESFEVVGVDGMGLHAVCNAVSAGKDGAGVRLVVDQLRHEARVARSAELAFHRVFVESGMLDAIGVAGGGRGPDGFEAEPDAAWVSRFKVICWHEISLSGDVRQTFGFGRTRRFHN